MKRKELEMYLERLESLKGFMDEFTLEDFQEKILRVTDFLSRFESLDKLIEQLKIIESISYTIKEYLTIDDVAKYLGVTKSMVYKLTSSKQITVYKPTGKGIYIRREDLMKWIKRNPVLSNEDLMATVNQKLFNLDNSQKRK